MALAALAVTEEKKGSDMATKQKTGQAVIITTERRGVFYGRLQSYDAAKRVAVLDNAIMAIRWGTTDGLLQLAATGPTDDSKLSAVAPSIRLELCECVIGVSPAAEAAWKRAAR